MPDIHHLLNNVKKSMKMDAIRVVRQGNPDQTGFAYLEMPMNNNEETPLLGERDDVKNFLDEAEVIPMDFIYRKEEASRRMYTLLTGFFMNPIEKWKNRRRFPWKLCFQILIIILGAYQMYSFGGQRSRHLRQNAEMKMTLNKMFLKDWAPEESVYPYINRLYAVYTAPDFFGHIDFAVNQYMKLNSISAGPYGYDNWNGKLSSPTFCVNAYEGQVEPEKSVINIVNLPKEECLVVPFPTNNTSDTFSFVDFLHQSNLTLKFGTLVHAKLHFCLRSVFMKSIDKIDLPECYRLNITITYDNSNHDGLIAISMKITPTTIKCQVQLKLIDEIEDSGYLIERLVNFFIILFSVFSIALCVRSLYRSCKLAQEAVWFFKYYHGKRIPLSEILDFIDFWYFNLIIGDFMVAAGSYLKSQIEEKNSRMTDYTGCSLLLGIGYLLILMGTLRYFRLFPTYNILLITLKKAMPNVLRFLMSVLLLFAGYCFCGWMVLAPYHTKFLSLSSTAESLFADMNGDEVYETFSILYTDLDSIWWFARIYLYSFFFLFLYLSASLLVSVIMDTFEMVKHMYAHGKTPTTVVEIFLATEKYEPVETSTSISNSFDNDVGLGYWQKVLILLKMNHQ